MPQSAHQAFLASCLDDVPVCLQVRVPHAGRMEQQVRFLEAAALEAATEAGRGAGRAAAAAAEAADPRVLAAVASVWLAFDNLPPPDEVQVVLAGGRGCWLPVIDAAAERLAAAPGRISTDSDEERWARQPMLHLPVVPALRDLGVAQGLGVEGWLLGSGCRDRSLDGW